MHVVKDKALLALEMLLLFPSFIIDCNYYHFSVVVTDKIWAWGIMLNLIVSDLA